jgi:hypothetical protein
MSNLIHSFWLFAILIACGLGLSFLAIQHDSHSDPATITILTGH